MKLISQWLVAGCWLLVVGGNLLFAIRYLLLPTSYFLLAPFNCGLLQKANIKLELDV